MRLGMGQALTDGFVVHVALSQGGERRVLPASDKALACFQGVARLVTILPGEEVWSDAFDFDLAAVTNVTVTIRFGETPAAVTGHPGSRATSYLRRGDTVAVTDMAGAAAVQHWYVLTGIDAEADAGCAAVVALGDSITDGRGSTTDGNNRWTDDLALRLGADERPLRTAVVNAGIGGNAVLAGGLGPTAMARFDRDVLEESGVRWVIVFEGVNDIGGSRDPSVAAGLISAYGKFIEKAHGKGLRIYGATITPFGGSMYFTPAHEAARQTVNTWIRTSGKFDAVIDFDSAVRDPSDSGKLLPTCDTGDHLHLNPAGYRAMAAAVDLKLFRRLSEKS